jgi:hypothetical protein
MRLVGVSKRVEWAFSVPAAEAIELLSNGLERMQAPPEVSKKRDLFAL